MKAIKIYAQDSKYFMEDLDTNITTELTDIRQDPKGTGDYIVLPENSANRKFCKVKKAIEGIQLDYKESKTFGPRNPDAPKTQKVKINLDEYLTDEEKAKIEKHEKAIADIKAKAHERAQKDIKMAELKAQLMALPEDVRNAMIAMMKGAEA